MVRHSDMTATGTNFAGYKDGHCVAIGYKMTGPGAAAFNDELLAEWRERGYEIREMPRDEAVAAHIAYIEQLSAQPPGKRP